jgi:DNA-binding FadR family transcriptional regulator
VRFPRLEQIRAHVYFAEQLRRQIMLGVMESEGIVVTGRGRGGGTFVSASPAGGAWRERLICGVRASRQLIEEAIAYRLAVEPAAAGCAAATRTGEDAAELTRIAGRETRTTDDALLTRRVRLAHVDQTARSLRALMKSALMSHSPFLNSRHRLPKA